MALILCAATNKANTARALSASRQPCSATSSWHMVDEVLAAASALRAASPSGAAGSALVLGGGFCGLAYATRLELASPRPAQATALRCSSHVRASLRAGAPTSSRAGGSAWRLSTVRLRARRRLPPPPQGYSTRSRSKGASCGRARPRSVRRCGSSASRGEKALRKSANLRR